MVDARNSSNWDDAPEPNQFYIDPNQFSEEDYEIVHRILMDKYDNESDATMDAFAIARVLMKNVTIDVGLDGVWFDIIVVKPKVRVA